MRKNYFVKLMNYMKNVYHIENGINKLADRRVNPKYKTPQVIMPLLLGFMIRIESMNELKFRLQKNEFINIFSRGTLVAADRYHQRYDESFLNKWFKYYSSSYCEKSDCEQGI